VIKKERLLVQIKTNDGLFGYFLLMIAKLNIFIAFIKLIINQRDLIFDMARREVRDRYIGSLLGFVWTFIQPVTMIFVFWFVFSVGFKSHPLGNVPFVVWLTAGMAAWFVFADIVTGSSIAVTSNTNLIKKTLFHAEILPVVKICSSLITHCIFLTVLFGLIILQDMPFSVYYLQFIYYAFCLCILALGLGWIFSSLNVFIRDIGQIVNIVIQIGFWATPIFWDIHIMSKKIQMILKLNPMAYVIQGYRESFIYFVPFWDHPYETLYFWTLTLTVFIAGALVFQRLKYQFADVL